jgi:hypothetical protein
MKKNYIVAMFCVATLALASCGGKKGTGMSASHVKIPKDAGLVVGVDMKQLQSKSYSLKDLLKSEVAKKITMDKKALDMLGKFLEAVDTDQKVYYFAKEAEKGSYSALSFVLKDSEKFKKLFDDATVPKMMRPEFKKEGDIQIAMYEPLAPFAIGFKDKTGLLMVNKSLASIAAENRGYTEVPSFDDAEDNGDDVEGLDEKPKKRKSLDDMDEEENQAEERPRRGRDRFRNRNSNKPAAPAKMTEAEFKKTFVQVFKTSAAESLQEKGFVASEAAGYDVSFWYDLQVVQSLQKMNMDRTAEMIMNASPFLKQLTNMKGTAYAGMKFERGEILVESSSELDKELVSKYGSIMSKTHGEKLAQTLPITSPTGIMTFSLDMNALFEILKQDKTSMEGMEMSAKEVDMKPKDIFDTFDGSLAMASGKFDAEKMMGGGSDALEFAIAVGLNKADNFKKLMKKSIAEGYVKDKGNGIYQIIPPRMTDDAPELNIIQKSKAFYFTISPKLKEDIMKGKGGLNTSNVKNSAMGMYLDFQKIYSMMPADAKKDKRVQISLGKMKEMVITASPLKGNTMSSKMVFRFTESKNALMVLADMVQQMVELDKRGDISLNQ